MSTRKISIIVGALTLALLVIGAGVYVGFHFFDNRALPNTYVGEHNVSGLKEKEIQELLEKTAAENTVTFYGKDIVPAQAKLADMGIKIKSSETAKAATAGNRIWSNYASCIFKKTDIAPLLDTDETKTLQFAATLTEDTPAIPRPINPEVIFNDDKFEVKEGKEGRGVSYESIIEAGTQLVSATKDIRFEGNITTIKPEKNPDQLNTQAQTANKIITPQITVTSGDQTFTATPENKASWITFNAENVSIDPAAINAWVEEQASAAQTEGEAGYRYVANDGEVLRVITEPVIATTVTNKTEVAGEILKNIKDHQDASPSFTIEENEPQWEEREVARGAEYLAYPAKEGERWVDISLSTYRVTAYIGGRAQASYPMVPGAPGYRTPVGRFAVYGKNRLQDMRGYNNDGSEYETKNVPYATYFYDDIAMHGSSAWRSEWGMDAGAGGSHGCVNMPDEGAAYMFNFTSIGTVVSVHY